MIFTKVFAIIAVVAATNVLASGEGPAAAPEKRQAGISCAIGGDVACNTVCKQEGNAEGGACNAKGTCVCN